MRRSRGLQRGSALGYVEKTLGVLAELLFDTGEGVALKLGLNRCNGLSVELRGCPDGSLPL